MRPSHTPWTQGLRSVEQLRINYSAPAEKHQPQPGVPHASMHCNHSARSHAPAVSLTGPKHMELDRSLRLLSNVKRKTRRPLDLREDLYDRKSGLTGEGVGTTHISAQRTCWRRGRSPLAVGKAIAAELRASAQRLGDSLYDLNYDQGFRLRTASGIWRTPDAAVESGGERLVSTSRRETALRLQRGRSHLLLAHPGHGRRQVSPIGVLDAILR